METLECRYCGADKPVSEFRKDAGTQRGYRSQCRACKSDYERARKLGKGVKPTLLTNADEFPSAPTVAVALDKIMEVAGPMNEPEVDLEHEAYLAKRREQARKRRERKRQTVAPPPQLSIVAAQQAKNNTRASEARVKAIKRLIINHKTEFQRLVNDEMKRLAVTPRGTWTPLVDMSESDEAWDHAVGLQPHDNAPI